MSKKSSTFVPDLENNKFNPIKNNYGQESIRAIIANLFRL